jgi:hypothetical protein
MRDASLLPLVQRSLEALRRECPEAYRRLSAALGRRVVRIDTGDEIIAIRGSASGVEATGGDAPAAVEAAMDKREILDLVEGRRSLEEALLLGRVEVRGAIEDLLALHDGLRWYVAGGVRSPSFAGLRHEYRAMVEDDRGEG